MSPQGIFVFSKHRRIGIAVDAYRDKRLRKMSTFLHSGLLFALLLPIFTQAQSLSGLVNDAESNQAVEGVRVEVAGTYVGAITDSLGRFNISGLEAGEYHLHFSHIGYADQERAAYLGQDAPTAVGVSLEPKEFAIPKEVVISARRSEESLASIPEMMSVMGQQELAERSPRSTPELMMSMPGVWMQKTNHGGGSAFLRGLTGNQTLLLIDGIRVNNSTYRYGPNQYLNTIDPFSIGKIEVLRGSGSVQYGSDALGGVIQILTPQAEFSAEKLETDISLQGKYMSADMEQSIRGTWEIRTPKLSVRMGVSYKNFGDLLAGGDLGVQSPSGYQELDGDFKAVFLLGQRQRMTLAWQRVDQREVGRFDQVAQRGYQIYQFDPQQRQLAYLKWERLSESKWARQFRATLSTQSSNEQRLKQRTESEVQRIERDEVFTLGASVEHEAQPTSSWHILSGVEFYHDQIASLAYDSSLVDNARTDLRGLYPDGASAANASVFSLHTVDAGNLSIRGGIRYNFFQLNAFDPMFGNLDLAPQALVGNLASTLRLRDWHYLTASVQTGFRAPNINDLSSFGSFDSGIEVPSPDLSSERSLSGELVYKVQHPRISGSLSLFQTQLFDLIAREPGTFQGSPTYQGEEVFQKANIEAAVIRGTEAEIQFRLTDQLTAYSSLTYTFGETIEDSPSPLRRIPPLFGVTGLRWTSGPGFGGRIEYRYAGKQDRLSSGDIKDHRIADGGTPAWQVLDAYLSYEWKVLQGRIGLQNLFDTAYRMHGSGVDGYGRSVWIAVQLNL